MRVLLTGFEPFGGAATNCTQMVVERLARDGIDGVDLRCAVLPVDGTRAPDKLHELLRSHQPESVICLGEAQQRDTIDIERVALNLKDYRIRDNAGEQPTDCPIDPDGPAAYFATFQARTMAEAVRAIGLPVRLSNDAGLFLCNHISYVLLHALAGDPNGASRAGFVHLPLVQEQSPEPDRPRQSEIPLDRMAIAVSTLIRSMDGA